MKVDITINEVLVGIAYGIYPARRASQHSLVDAVRFECGDDLSAGPSAILYSGIKAVSCAGFPNRRISNRIR
jgi:hypothetical protein